MQCVDVGATIEQEAGRLARRRDRPVQRRAPRAIAQVDEPGLCGQKSAHAGDVAGGGRIVDRVIGRGWPGPPAVDVCVFEQPGNSLVAAVAGGGYGIRTVEFQTRHCTYSIIILSNKVTNKIIK